MKFNLLKSNQQNDFKPLEPGKEIENVKSFDTYLELTKQAAIESVGGSLGLTLNIETLLRLERYSKYFASEFTETEDDEFKEIKEIIFRGMWSNDAIYIAYSQELLDLELTLATKYPGLNRWKVKPNCKWRAYTIKKNNRDEIRYTSLITAITDLKIDEEELVEIRWDNGYVWRFLSWWKIASIMNDYEKSFFELTNVALKRVLTSTSDERNRDEVKKAILDGSVTLNRVGTQSLIHFEAIEFAKIPELSVFFDSAIQWFYFNAGQLGYTGNTSEKAERMTTGDHMKDLKTVVNNQQCTLEHLESFAAKAKEKWGKELNFEVTSMMSMDGSNIQINDGETPQGPDNKKPND